MFQVRFHGRGGQGVVTAAELLASAAFLQDRYAQAFPSFGSERMGAQVMSFCRIDDKPIRTREPVTEPDALLIQDPTLLHQSDLFAGLTANGYVLVNSTKGFAELGLAELAAQHPADRLPVPATAGHRPPGPPAARRADAGRPRRPIRRRRSAWTRCSPRSGKVLGRSVAAGNSAAARAAFDTWPREPN